MIFETSEDICPALNAKIAKLRAGTYRIDIRRAMTRSLNQNRLYWLRNRELIDYQFAAWGWTEQDIHEEIMLRAGHGERIVRKLEHGNGITTTVEHVEYESSTKLDPGQFSKLYQIQDELLIEASAGVSPEMRIELSSKEII
jgi:hypothetical protein